MAIPLATHIILVTAKQRFHDETGTGALGTASTGVKARVSYAASYFDGADWLTGVVDVGTNGGSSYTRPSTVPSRSVTVLATTTAYNSAGLAWKRIDPRGIETRGYFNALGDVTKSIENYVDGVVSDTDDKITESTYNAAGLTTVRVVLPSGGQQVTEWVHGVTTSGGSGLNSNDLVKEVRYPAPSTGASSSSSKDVRIRPADLSITHNCDPGHTPVGCPRVLSGRATAQCGLAGRRGVG